jgi:hypothetical protein
MKKIEKVSFKGRKRKFIVFQVIEKKIVLHLAMTISVEMIDSSIVDC